MLDLSSITHSNQIYCFRVINTLVTLSIQEPFVLSRRRKARKPPPHPVAIDANVAETTLPLHRIAVSTPQEVTQWTRNSASARKKNIYQSAPKATITWNKEFSNRPSTTDWGRSPTLILILLTPITDIRTNQVGCETNGTTEITQHLTMSNTSQGRTT